MSRKPEGLMSAKLYESAKANDMLRALKIRLVAEIPAAQSE